MISNTDIVIDARKSIDLFISIYSVAVSCKSMSISMAYNIKHQHLTAERRGRTKAGRFN